MEENNRKHYEYLKDKSIQSFLLCLEIFNKPTIDYRLEGCVFFLCNAWELMLKAKLLKDGVDIYYPGSTRTISLSDAAAKIMTNKNDPVRINLSVIIALRNTSTHDIIPEFEIIYLPFVTFCVKAFVDKFYDYIGENVTDYIKTDFLSLFAHNKQTNTTDILSRYGQNITTMFEERISGINDVLKEKPELSIRNEITVNIVRVNNAAKADYSFYASRNPKDKNITYVDRYHNINDSHQLTYHNVVDEIDRIIKTQNIPFTPIKEPIPTPKKPNPNIFTTGCLDCLNKEYHFKDNEEYCQPVKYGNGTINKYSQKLVTRIIALIMDDKDVVIKAKEKLTLKSS